MSNIKTVRLILGDQLNYHHSWFKNREAHVTYLMMEVLPETSYVMHHIQKLVAFFSAMRAFAEHLQKSKHNIIYICLDNLENNQSFEANINRLIQKHNFQSFEYMLPDEYRLDQQLRNITQQLPIPSRVVDSEHFLTQRNDVKNFFKEKKQYLMESFYRHIRKKHDILLENGKPTGGKWNYDQSNRNPYDSAVPIPDPVIFHNDVQDILNMIRCMEVRTFGNIQSKELIWPINREQSLIVLNDFIENRLPHFGTYQDAMTKDSWFLFHSRLSFAMNTKMLHPMEVVKHVLGKWNQTPNHNSLQQVEGFIRQIIGWREYMRGMYWAFMPNYGRMNIFHHSVKLPHYYWDGETNMQCIKYAITQSLDYAYAHHIQQLMVTGNFALLAGIDPDEVDAWYLGVYIDAIEWVEITNTRGMSQYADGGIIASKPYVSSANYIHKMSDYCTRCFYTHSQKYGEGSCPFNSLYWNFFERHRKILANHPRVGIMYRTWDRMPSDKKKHILKTSENYKKKLEHL